MGQAVQGGYPRRVAVVGTSGSGKTTLARNLAQRLAITHVELDAIQKLIEAGVIVITVGGGGIPVIENQEGDLEGVAAVIDKDHASALLARRLNADLFIISTSVEYVYVNFDKPDQRAIREMTVAEAEQYIKEGHFAKGSMLPKMEAVVYYLRHGGKEVIITDPPNVPRALRGETGTRIVG